MSSIHTRIYTVTASFDGFDESTTTATLAPHQVGYFCASFRAQGYRHLSLIPQDATLAQLPRNRSAWDLRDYPKLEMAVEKARELYWSRFAYEQRGAFDHILIENTTAIRAVIHRLILIRRKSIEFRCTHQHAAPIVDQAYPILRAQIEGSPYERELL